MGINHLMGLPSIPLCQPGESGYRQDGNWGVLEVEVISAG